jgi:hypothetical protein
MCVDTIFCWPENWVVRLANGARIESGIDHLCHLPENHLENLVSSTLFSDLRRRKKEPHIRILAGFLVMFGVNCMAEPGSIAGALAAHGRGANLPYFGKQTNI